MRNELRGFGCGWGQGGGFRVSIPARLDVQKERQVFEIAGLPAIRKAHPGIQRDGIAGSAANIEACL